MRYGSTLLSNAAISTFATLLQGAANLATVVYLARALAPTAYGVFSYTWAFTALFGFLTILGIPPFLTRQLSRQTGDVSEVISYGISLTAGLSVMVMVFFVLSVQTIPGLVDYHLLFDCWSLIFLQLGLNPQWIFSALQRLWIPMTLNVAGAVLRLGFTLWLVHSPADLYTAVVVTVATLVATVIAQMVWLYHLVPYRLVRISWTKGWRTIRDSLPMGVMSFVGVLYTGVDTWILHAVIGSQAVGYYTAGYRPIIFLLMLSSVYFNLAYPFLSRFIIKDPTKAREFLRLATLVMLSIVLPVAFGGDVVANSLMRIAFGLRYVTSGPVFAVLIWSWSVSLMRDVFSTALIARNHEKMFAKLFALSGVINVLLMLVLVRWGPVGTAGALVITQILLLVLNVVMVQRLGIFSLESSLLIPFVKVLANSVAMTAIVWIIRPYVPLWVDIGAGLVSYGGLTFIDRALPLRMLYRLTRDRQVATFHVFSSNDE